MEASIKSCSIFFEQTRKRLFFFFWKIPKIFWMSESLEGNPNAEPMRALKRFSCMKSHKRLHIFVKYIAVC